MKISHKVLPGVFVLLSVVAVGSREPLATAGDDWPQWRGPHSDGISRETGLLTDWSEQKPKVLWQQALGSGFSSISVVGDRLYTMAAVDDVEYTFCLDTDTGNLVWRVPIGARHVDPQGGDGPRSTPTVVNDVVYTLGAEGRLMCLDARTGRERWQRNILEDFGAENLQWGVSTSPYVDGDNLLVNVGGPGASVVAFEKKTGNVAWQSLDDVAGYASPIRINVTGPDGANVPELVFFCGRSLIGLSPADGSLHWRHEWITTSNMNIATPIYEPRSRLLFISASRDTGRCAAYRLTARDGAVACELVYRNQEMKNHYNGCVLIDGCVYGFDNSVLKCIQLETGQVMWVDRTVGKGSLVAAQGHLFVLGERGDLAVVEATPREYREKGRIQAFDSSRAWSPPALANGRLYVRDLEKIACLDIGAR